MCQCTPEIRTPFCGKPGCEWPEVPGSAVNDGADIVPPMKDRNELRCALADMFPLASYVDLPWKPDQLKAFLRDRIEREVVERTFHFQSRVVRILCEISPPKTHVEDMTRIVVERAKLGQEAIRKLDDFRTRHGDPEELLRCIRDIGKVVGCNHTEDEDGRRKLVSCVRESVNSKQPSA